jgi:hypothetical protein
VSAREVQVVPLVGLVFRFDCFSELRVVGGHIGSVSQGFLLDLLLVFLDLFIDFAEGLSEDDFFELVSVNGLGIFLLLATFVGTTHELLYLLEFEAVVLKAKALPLFYKL